MPGRKPSTRIASRGLPVLRRISARTSAGRLIRNSPLAAVSLRMLVWTPRLMCRGPVCAPHGTHDVHGFTLFPMSQNAHAIMFVSERGVSAERIPSHKILTHFADIPVVRAVVILHVTRVPH